MARGRSGTRSLVAAPSGLLLSAGAVALGLSSIITSANPAAGQVDPATAAVGPVPVVPTHAQNEGVLASDTPLQLAVVLKSQDATGLRSMATAVSTPGSPLFRHYLVPSVVADRFGAPATSLGAVRSWLSGAGLQVGSPTGDGLVIPVSGTASAVQGAFRTTLHSYQLPGGRTAYANTVAPEVPANLAPEVEGIVGLDNLTTPQPAGRRLPGGGGHPGEGTIPEPNVGTGGPQACSQAKASGGATAEAISHLYGVDPLYQAGRFGQGVTIGLYELADYNNGAVTSYEQCYGLSTVVNRIPVLGGSASIDGEVTLDIQVLLGMAPGATIDVYEGPNSNAGALLLYATIAQQDRADVVSSSWGSCEPVEGATAFAEASFFEQMALQGQSMFAAAGDEGSEDCDSNASPPPPPYSDSFYQLNVDDPASQPFVTGVGGTQIPDHTSGTPKTEVVWNLSGNNSDGSGYEAPFNGQGAQPNQYPGNLVSTGGISTNWTMPPWQVGFDTSGNSSGGPCHAPAGSLCREVPDVAALAGPPGYAITSNDGTTWGGYDGGGGGTSAASPLWASLTALAAEGAPNDRLGLVSPSLYSIYRSTSSAFTDVIKGQNNYLAQAGTPNNYSCTYPVNGVPQPGQPCYEATPGYDMVSGLGTPVASVLVPALDSMAQLGSGYTMAASDGGVFTFGNAGFFGSMGGTTLNAPVVGVATTPDDQGYWLAGADGAVFAFGDAGFFGSMGSAVLRKPIVGMTATPDGGGYWLAAADGGIFAFGDAGFFGSMGGRKLNSPVVGMASTPTGAGYWEVAADGGIFAFGDAAFRGSMGGHPLNQPIVGLASAPDGGGYWLVASDGGIFAFGDAGFFGSMGGQPLNKPIVAMTTASDGKGYLLTASDGGAFAFGSALFAGSLGGITLARPVVGVAGG